MLNDHSIHKEIIRRAVAGAFGDNPNQAVHSLGSREDADGREVPVHLRHAADAVLLDDFGHVVLITRSTTPALASRHCPAVLWTLSRELTGNRW